MSEEWVNAGDVLALATPATDSDLGVGTAVDPKITVGRRCNAEPECSVASDGGRLHAGQQRQFALASRDRTGPAQRAQLKGETAPGQRGPVGKG